MISWFQRKPPQSALVQKAYGLAPKLYRVAYARLGNVQDAEDIVQETFLRVHRAQHSYRESGHLEAWLMRILINTIREHVRKATRGGTVLSLDSLAGDDAHFDIASDDLSPEEALLTNEVDE